MDKKVETSQLKKALQYLSISLDKCTTLEAIVAGIIISKNLNNIGRPIGLINLGRNMIKEMSSDNDTEIIVYTNLLNSIINEEKDSFELLPGYSNANQNCVDQYLNSRFNKREMKEIHNYMGNHNMLREHENHRAQRQFDYNPKEYMRFPNFRLCPPQMGFKPREKSLPQNDFTSGKIKNEDLSVPKISEKVEIQSKATDETGRAKSVVQKHTKGKK